MTTDIVDVKAALTEGLTELRLPTVMRIYEEQEFSAGLFQEPGAALDRYRRSG